jgi:hypothetical protein
MGTLTEWRRVSLLGIVGLLALWYVLLGYWALNPRVSNEYRTYYIDRTTTLTPIQQWQKIKGLAQPLHTIPLATDDDFFAFWFSTEAGRTWRSWPSAVVSFKLKPEDEPRGLMIIATSYAATYLDDQQVSIELNGARVADFHTRRVPGQFWVEFDKNLLKVGDANQLRFNVADGQPSNHRQHGKPAMPLDFIEIY